METIKAYRHDLCPSAPAYGIRGYQCENGWFILIEGEDYERMKHKFEFWRDK